MVRLEAVLESCKAVRQNSAQTVEEFPAADFDFKPAGDAMSFRESASDILRTGDDISGLLLDGVDKEQPTHRAQMFVYLRLKGPVPAPSRRRLIEARA